MRAPIRLRPKPAAGIGLCLLLVISCQSVPGAKAPASSAPVASPRSSPSSSGPAAAPEAIVPKKRPPRKALTGIRLPDPPLPARTPAPPPSPMASPSPTPKAASPSPKASLRPPASPSAKPSPSASAKSLPRASAKPGPSASAKAAPQASPSPTFPPVPFSAIKSLSSEEMQKKAAYSLVVKRGSGFEIPLNGTAWTYIGTSGSAEGILYRNRKYEGSKVYFQFDPVVVGEYLLEFKRQDVLLDDIETVYVRVIVDPEEGSATLLPSGGQPSPSAAASTAGALTASGSSPLPAAVTAGGKANPAGAPAASPSPAAEDLDSYDGPGLLKKLQKDLDAGKAEAARADLESYKLRFPLGDEYLYWAARYYESPGPQRDILAARALYRRLMDEYPESPRYDEADARIEYIDKRYLEIR